MKKIISAKEAVNLIKEGSSVMIGGFLSCGTPDNLIDALVEQGTKNLTMISNDTSVPNTDRGKLVENKQLKKVITSHIGTNPETGKQLLAGELEVDLVPMGTLFEKIRSKGAGLGGVLTPTGVGTFIEENKEIVEIDGRKLLDGAICDGIPVKFFESIGYERNVAILTQEKGYRLKPFPLMPLFRVVYRKFPEFIKAMATRHLRYNEALADIEKQEASGKLFVIRPEEPLPVKTVERDPEKLTEAYGIGRRTALRHLNEIKKFLTDI